MPEEFNNALKDTLIFEGGYVNDPADRGGETFRGISRKNWPNWPGWPLLDDAKRGVGVKASAIDNFFTGNSLMDEFVANFYQIHFWRPFEHFELDRRLKAKLFDTAVNSGVSRAVELLQRSLNRFNAGLRVDGILGPRTLEAAGNIDDTEKLLKIYCLEQRNRYRRIAESRPSQTRFLKGWERRAAWLPE